MSEKMFAVVRFTAEGWHLWKNAPTSRLYLASGHRHLFNVEVMVQVFEDDREIEFHDLLDFGKIEFGQGEFGGASCETMARRLKEKMTTRYPNRHLNIKVFEDGEVGATLMFSPV